MTHYLTHDLARLAALTAAKPLLDHLVLLDKTGGRESIHIVLVDPDSPRNDPRILFERTFGVIAEDKEYVAIAQQKAFQAWINKMDTRELIRLRPHLLRDGNVLFAGGVFRHGLAVGVSGLPSAWDEVIGVAFAETCRAMCTIKSEAVIADDDAPLFLPSSTPTAA